MQAGVGVVMARWGEVGAVLAVDAFVMIPQYKTLSFFRDAYNLMVSATPRLQVLFILVIKLHSNTPDKGVWGLVSLIN